MIINHMTNKHLMVKTIRRVCQVKFKEGYGSLVQKGDVIKIKLSLHNNITEFDVLFLLEMIIEKWFQLKYNIKVTYRTLNYVIYNYTILLTPE